MELQRVGHDSAQHSSLKFLPIPQSKLFYSLNVRDGRIDALWRNINKIGQWGRAEENLNSDNRSFPSFNVHLLTCPAYACNWLSPGKECNSKNWRPSSSVCAVWLCFVGLPSRLGQRLSLRNLKNEN